MERLQKYLSECGVASRRESEKLIASGKVRVNGKIVTEMGVKVTDKDEVEVDGIGTIKQEKEYFLLYKPDRIICSVKDEKGRPTVIDLIKTEQKVFPVGRLDYDTTGLILITNDGELSNLLTHPKSNVEKTYLAKVDGLVRGDELRTLEKGVKIDNFVTKKAKLKLKKYDKDSNKSYVEITISEGKNHQVKKMFDAIGHKVIKLKRTNYAFLDLTGMKIGEYRKLSIKEVKQLYAYIKQGK